MSSRPSTVGLVAHDKPPLSTARFAGASPSVELKPQPLFLDASYSDGLRICEDAVL
jgi:hypothetical protein